MRVVRYMTTAPPKSQLVTITTVRCGHLNIDVCSAARNIPRMNLDEGQRGRVAEWIEQGLKLSEIQDKLSAELGVSMTYM